MNRLDDLVALYQILDVLEQRLGGKRTLRNCDGRQDRPRRGVYFFFERGEHRAQSGAGPRVVRVGTHALKPGSRTSLWNRLSQHKGARRSGGGNHRGSIFRLLTGQALISRDELDVPTWGIGSDPGKAATRLGLQREQVKSLEQPVEVAASEILGGMELLWLGVDDEPGADSLRGYLERNTISLLSNYRRASLDLPSIDWLGRFSNRERVRRSGLWNSNHVDEPYAPDLVDVFRQQMEIATTSNHA
jgi:hypothetical protein